MQAQEDLRRPWPVAGRLPRPGLIAAVFLVAGTLYRLVLLLVHVPMSEGDESIIGLMALHVARGQDYPLYFYGDDYMGSLEAYLAAPVIWLFGPTQLALRLPMVLITYVAFGWLMYHLTARLYDRWLAVVVTALLALGDDHTIQLQLRASGGYPEMCALAAALMLVAAHLALGPARPGWRRALTFGLWGLIAGVVLWNDWLPLPFLAAAGMLLLVFCWRELLRWGGLAMVAGAVLGATPMIVHVAHAEPGRNVLTEVLFANTRLESVPLGLQVYNAVMIGVPVGTGLCSPTQCHRWQIAWAPVYLLLLAVAAALAGYALVRWIGRRRPAAGRPERVRQAARLGLVAAAAVTIALYAHSSGPASAPISQARYLHTLPVTLPAVLWPLWAAAEWLPRANRSRRTALVGGLGGAVLVGLALTMAFTTAAAIVKTPPLRAAHTQITALTAGLTRLGVTRVYSDYGTCNLVSFRSGERVACAVIQDDLHRGRDRYAPFRAMVTQDPHPAYVIKAGSPMQRAFEDRLRQHPARIDEVVSIAGYRVYRPATNIPPEE